MTPLFAEPTPEEWWILFKIARGSIEEGLRYQQPLKVSPEGYSRLLKSPGACFVTLRIGTDLRGCMGSLKASLPLVQDVAQNAFSAAFRDPRFPPLLQMEYKQTHLHISILEPPQPMTFTDEEDLLNQIVPGQDGLILSADGKSGTFLPSVWETLPEKREFWRALKLKAHLPESYWSSSVQVSRYHTYSAEEDELPFTDSDSDV